MNYSLRSIHKNTIIGKNVKIDPFTTINDNVEIGDNTWIASNVTIMSGARIGNNCKIFPGAVISAIPQDLKFNNEESIAIIGNNSIIRECVTVNRGTKATGKTIVGENCLIMAYAHIAHDCIIHNNAIVVNSCALGGHVTIGESAILGGLSAVHQFVNIGAHSIISGGSLVRKDVPPFVKAAKEPLRFVGINSIGLERRGFSKHTINNIKEIYRTLFQSKLNNSDALNHIKNNFSDSSEKKEIINFYKQSGRGIMKGFSSLKK